MKKVLRFYFDKFCCLWTSTRLSSSCLQDASPNWIPSSKLGIVMEAYRTASSASFVWLTFCCGFCFCCCCCCCCWLCPSSLLAVSSSSSILSFLLCSSNGCGPCMLDLFCFTVCLFAAFDYIALSRARPIKHNVRSTVKITIHCRKLIPNLGVCGCGTAWTGDWKVNGGGAYWTSWNPVNYLLSASDSGKHLGLLALQL